MRRRQAWILFVLMLASAFAGLSGIARAQEEFAPYNPENPYVVYAMRNPRNEVNEFWTTDVRDDQTTDNFGLDVPKRQVNGDLSAAIPYEGPFSQTLFPTRNAVPPVLFEAQLAHTGLTSTTLVATAMALFLTGGCVTIATRERGF